MKTLYLVLLGIIIAAGVIALVPSDAYIPPTRAFMRIFSGSENVTADSYYGNLTFTGYGIDINPIFSNQTIQFTTSGTSNLAMEQLTNVTSSGCAVGQARTVNASGWYVCSNVGTGDITGAANVGTGTGTVFRDEVLGTLNFKTLKEGANISITNNADDITITAAAGALGYTKINNLNGGTAKILATNASNQATVKTLTAGTGITITNGSKTITIESTGSGFTEMNSINGGTARLLKSNSTNEAVFKSLTCSDMVKCTNSTTTITINSEVNTISGGNAKIVKSNTTNGEVVIKSLTAGTNISLTNGTDTITIAASVSGGATVLAANVTATTSTSVDTLIWTIPLTANSGNQINGFMVASSGTTGQAIRGAANVTSLQSRGYCSWEQVSSASANAVDNLVLNTVLTGRASNTGETAWIAAANQPMPIKFYCSIQSGATPGNLKIWITPEIASTVMHVKAGSFYIKTP